MGKDIREREREGQIKSLSVNYSFAAEIPMVLTLRELCLSFRLRNIQRA